MSEAVLLGPALFWSVPVSPEVCELEVSEHFGRKKAHKKNW